MVSQHRQLLRVNPNHSSPLARPKHPDTKFSFTRISNTRAHTHARTHAHTHARNALAHTHTQRLTQTHTQHTKEQSAVRATSKGKRTLHVWMTLFFPRRCLQQEPVANEVLAGGNMGVHPAPYVFRVSRALAKHMLASDGQVSNFDPKNKQPNAIVENPPMVPPVLVLSSCTWCHRVYTAYSYACRCAPCSSAPVSRAPLR